jgi:GNAT superfamily N-acetyltransferase
MMATAFAANPVAAWLLPCASTRQIVLNAYFLTVWSTRPHQAWIDVVDACIGAAVWHACRPGDGVNPGGGLDDEDSGEAAIAGATKDCPAAVVELAATHLPAPVHPVWIEAGNRFRLLRDALLQVRPVEEHDELAFLGVLPEGQGNGIGSALLAYHHRTLDHARRAGFVVATSPVSRLLCSRHNYDQLRSVALPDGPRLWPMRREPLVADWTTDRTAAPTHVLAVEAVSGGITVPAREPFGTHRPVETSIRDGADVMEAWLLAGQAYFVEDDWSGWVVTSTSWTPGDHVYRLVVGDVFTTELMLHGGGFVLLERGTRYRLDFDGLALILTRTVIELGEQTDSGRHYFPPRRQRVEEAIHDH